jgi:hypothetical protein
VLFGGMEELIDKHGELIHRYLFTKAVDYRVDKFAALHAAYVRWRCFTCPGVSRAAVTYFLFLSPDAVDFSRTLIISMKEPMRLSFRNRQQRAAAAGLHCGAISICRG